MLMNTNCIVIGVCVTLISASGAYGQIVQSGLSFHFVMIRWRRHGV